MFELFKNIFVKKQIQPLGSSINSKADKAEPKIKQIKQGFSCKSELKSNK
jgi:hypothetical protein